MFECLNEMTRVGFAWPWELFPSVPEWQAKSILGCTHGFLWCPCSGRRTPKDSSCKSEVEGRRPLGKSAFEIITVHEPITMPIL